MAITDSNKQFDNILSSIGTDEVKTLDQLYDLQSRYAPSNVYLPLAENTYEVDLKTRTIYGPEFISTQRDHKAEVIQLKLFSLALIDILIIWIQQILSVQQNI